MVVLVGALDEVGVVGVDCELDLADELVLEPDVHEDVVGSFPEPVLDSDDAEEGGLVAAELVEVLEQPKDLFFLGCDLAAHQVSYFEADEVGRRSPPRPPDQFLIINPFGHPQQAMDQPVQIQQYVRVQIVHNINGEDASCFFDAIDMREIVALEGAEQMHGLLVVVILEDLLHKLLDLDLLLFDHIVDDGLHPGEVGVHVAALLALHVLSAVQEVVLLLELRPQLVAPFGQDSQDGGALYDHVLARDLGLGVLGYVLGDLAADRPRGVALHPFFVLLLICLFEAVLLVALLLVLPVLHPVAALQRHEALLHEIIKILVEGHLPLGLLIDLAVLLIQPPDEVIGQLHNQIVIIAALPQLEPITILRVVKDIVFEGLDVIDVLDLALQGVVDHLPLGHRVLGQQVRGDAFFDVLVDAFHLGWVEAVMLV